MHFVSFECFKVKINLARNNLFCQKWAQDDNNELKELKNEVHNARKTMQSGQEHNARSRGMGELLTGISFWKKRRKRRIAVWCCLGDSSTLLMIQISWLDPVFCEFGRITGVVWSTIYLITNVVIFEEYAAWLNDDAYASPAMPTTQQQTSVKKIDQYNKNTKQIPTTRQLYKQQKAQVLCKTVHLSHITWGLHDLFSVLCMSICSLSLTRFFKTATPHHWKNHKFTWCGVWIGEHHGYRNGVGSAKMNSTRQFGGWGDDTREQETHQDWEADPQRPSRSKSLTG
jgi:hypothetical protein